MVHHDEEIDRCIGREKYNIFVLPVLTQYDKLKINGFRPFQQNELLQQLHNPIHESNLITHDQFVKKQIKR